MSSPGLPDTGGGGGRENKSQRNVIGQETERDTYIERERESKRRFSDKQ